MADSGVDRDRRKWLTGAVGGAVAASFLVPSAEAQPGPGPVSLILGTGAGQALPGPYGAFIFLPQNYGAITDGGFFGDGLAHPASANGFATLAALQSKFRAASFTATGSGTNFTVSNVLPGAVYAGLTLGVTTGIGSGIKIVSQTSGTPNGAGVYVTSGATTISGAAATASWASATSNDMAGLMIQAAYHAAHLAGGASVNLQNGFYYNLPQGFVFPAGTGARLIGSSGTAILCSPTGTNPGITINSQGNIAPFECLQLWASDTKEFGGSFVANSVAVHYIACNTIELRDVVIQNFDTPETYDVPIGGNYMICHRNWNYQLNNFGIYIDELGANNSFERMSWDNCCSGSNNTNVHLNFASGETIGTGSPIAADANLINCSLDYPNTKQLWYNNGDQFDLLSTVQLITCHIETSSSVTGSSNRIDLAGRLGLTGCYWFENGSNPSGLVSMILQQSALSVIGCHNGCFASSDATQVPFLTGDSSFNVSGYGNYGRGVGNIALLFNVGAGAVNSAVQADPQWYTASGSFTLSFAQPTEKNIPCTAVLTVTIPDNATTPFAVGSTFIFTSTSHTITFAALNGSVTLVSSGTGNTFGGVASKPATVFATKTLTDTWAFTGAMT